LAGVKLGATGRVVVREAKRLPLGRPGVHALPPGQAHAVSSAAEAASLHAFHLGMAIAAVLVAVGGLVGVAWIRNPRAGGDTDDDVHAVDCAGGQLVGINPEAAV
jgi:hypothetical protein